MAIQVGVLGACGRMGQRVVHCLSMDSNVRLAAALESSTHPQLGQDIGAICGMGPKGVLVSDKLPDKLDVLIDFSIPEASAAAARMCAERRLPLVIATTGHTPAQREEIQGFATVIPLLVAANLSLVVNVLMKLAEQAGKALRDKDFDVEIIEQHHRYKQDAPSGTALRFAEILEGAMGLTRRRHGREGMVGERPRDEIGLHAVRTGDNVGQHTIILSTIGETLELVHRSSSRDSYAKGAVAAAKFLHGKSPGLYTMADVLGL